ncbi:hypothetical protein P1X14_02175 [Sphingomonas sp. AOB5]|uniref:hypothetical protein n=1 Tax=Sphingomonas sp. AOB5 TaxID=3034017 RepID=UPI0023F98D4A|nr:hypothetical protein [Sphingomonas sp. AOB5]MDF7774040.1 hypothetical protein [Sphingomonas sp. AOB5]
MRRYWVITLIMAGLSSPAWAAEYLTSVASEVYQTTGTPREIATRASTCISQHLSPGTVDAQLIISSDLEGGIIVARNAIEQGGSMRWQLRSRFTFEARDGRFRIEQTELERFNQGRWGPIGKWPGSQWRGAEDAFKTSADAVARCVMTSPRRDDW